MKQVNSAEETETISRAEYERLQAQSEQITKLEHQVELLTEAIHIPSGNKMEYTVRARYAILHKKVRRGERWHGTK